MERRGSPLLPKNQRQQPQQAPLLPPQNEAVDRAATSSEAPTTSVAGPSTTGRTEPHTPSAAKESAVQPSEIMDLRDRLLAGIVEDSSSEKDDDSAEVIIEPDGRIKVHPRQKPNYLRNGGTLEPPSFGAGLRADRGALDRDTQTAEYLLLLELLKSQRQDKGARAGSARAGSARAGSGRADSARADSARAGGLNALLQDEIRKLVIEEATSQGGTPLAFAELKSGSRSDPDTSSTEGQYSDSRMLASPTGYFLAFIVGFGGILIIAMLCCIIRAAYVRQQKARLKKLLAEKLQGTEEAEALGLTKPAFYEVVESEPSGKAPSKDPTADPDWVDVRVEQQAPPEENQMITVARQDTLSKAGLPAETTDEEQASQQQSPTKSKKKQKKKSAEGGLWADEESGKDRGKSRKKPSRGSDDERAAADAREEKKKKVTRRGKEFKKALSSRKALRPVG